MLIAKTTENIIDWHIKQVIYGQGLFRYNNIDQAMPNGCLLELEVLRASNIMPTKSSNATG